MSTSVIRKSAFKYWGFAAFVFVFGAIYEFFSHEVYSNYMIYAFVVPLIGGLMAQLYLWSARGFKKKDCFAAQILAGGVFWLTLGCLFQGVLEIYGTTNHLIWVFLVVGLIQVVASIVWQAVSLMTTK